MKMDSYQVSVNENQEIKRSTFRWKPLIEVCIETIKSLLKSFVGIWARRHGCTFFHEKRAFLKVFTNQIHSR